MRVLLEAKLGHHLERRRPLVQMHRSILLLAEVRRMHWRLIEALTLEWIPLHVFIRRLSIQIIESLLIRQLLKMLLPFLFSTLADRVLHVVLLRRPDSNCILGLILLFNRHLRFRQFCRNLRFRRVDYFLNLLANGYMRGHSGILKERSGERRRNRRFAHIDGLQVLLL